MHDSSTDKRRRPPLRAILDVAASIVLLVAGATVISKNVAGPTTPSLRIPKSPVDVAGAPVLGSASARTALIVFSDFECPFCGRFSRETLPALVREYVDSGRVAVVFSHFPLPNHPNAIRAATAAECAGSQGRFWPMHDAMFQDAARLDEAGLKTLASSVGLDVGVYEACLAKGARATIEKRAAGGRELGVVSTPSFLIGKRLGDGRVVVTEAITGVRPLADFRDALDSSLSVERPKGGWFQFFTSHISLTKALNVTSILKGADR